MKRFALAFALVVTSPALAQPAERLDPARLASAGKLIDIVMPAEQREAMLGGLMQAMTLNMTKAMEGNQDVAALFKDDPRARAIFERFMARQQTESIETLRESLPGMIEAMRRAYARRFTVAQMDELSTFFATPTGRAYMAQGMSIMSDPDVAAWQQSVMTRTMARMPEQTRALAAEILALKPPAEPVSDGD